MMATRTRVAAVVVLAALAAAAPKAEKFEIRIVHTNDMHSRFEETSRFSGPCRDHEQRQGKCYGGFARIATLVRQARADGETHDLPTFFLNAGDTYQGSRLFLHYHWKIVARFLNILKPDAASLGNHEFDDGVAGLVPFLQNVTFPVVTANLDLSKEPSLEAASSLKPWVILTAKDRKIGIIGFLTPDTKHLSRAGAVEFLDEVEVIKKEAKALTSQGCDIIIALGHSGYETDKRIAEQVDEVDLVIGGHTNTFLWNGEKPDEEEPEGLYPTVIDKTNGGKGYVVQAYAYTKYLGDLRIQFDEGGKITKIEGKPILVDSSVAKAEDVEEELKHWVEEVSEPSLIVVGTTKVVLNGEEKICRFRECNFGNLAADAMVAYNAIKYTGDNQWTDAPIGVQQSGGIRSSIVPFNENQILKDDVNTAFPFRTSVVKVSMPAKILMEMLEHSIEDRIDETKVVHGGAFLQVSGIQVTYDISKPVKSRVVSVKVRCTRCLTPIFEKLNMTDTYTLIMPEFMHNGGDGYSMLRDLPYTDLNVNVTDLVSEYINRSSPITIGTENRITVLGGASKSPNSGFSYAHQLPTSLLFFSCALALRFL